MLDLLFNKKAADAAIHVVKNYAETNDHSQLMQLCAKAQKSKDEYDRIDAMLQIITMLRDDQELLRNIQIFQNPDLT